jgi:hypothetical protein
VANSLRVLLAPLQQEERLPGAPSTGTRVSLTLFGPAGSNLDVGQTLPARLRFVGHFLSSVRNGGPQEERELAVLDGTVTRREDQVRFVGTGAGLQSKGPDLGKYESESPPRAEPDKPLPRVLKFAFDPTQFEQVFAPGQRVARVLCEVGSFNLTADAEGFVTILLPEVCPVKLPLQWGPADAKDLPFELDLAPDCTRRSDGSEAVARLNNLGYPAYRDIDFAVRAFQRAYEVDASPEPVGLLDGRLPALTRAKLDAIFSAECDARPQSQMASPGGG